MSIGKTIIGSAGSVLDENDFETLSPIKSPSQKSVFEYGRDNWMDKRSTFVDLNEFGLVADYVYPFGGTDNTSFWNAAIAHIATLSPSENNRVTLAARRGEYLFNDYLDEVPPFVDLLLDGCILKANITDDVFDTPFLTIGSFDTNQNAGVMRLPSVHSNVYWNSHNFGPDFDETNIGIKLQNTNNAQVYLSSISGFNIGIQFYAGNHDRTRKQNSSIGLLVTSNPGSAPVILLTGDASDV